MPTFDNVHVVLVITVEVGGQREADEGQADPQSHDGAFLGNKVERDFPRERLATTERRRKKNSSFLFTLT